MHIDLVAVRRDIHRHPELAFSEHRTCRVVEDALASLGISSRRCAGTGIVADVTGTRPGPTIALRADMDALPISERTGLPYASLDNGKMHACGHDAHTAILLGAAENLINRRDDLRGTVRLLFQPAEETGEGAKAMIADGALDGVAAIYGLHNDPKLAAGTVAVAEGPILGASVKLSMRIVGEGGHAAFPHRARDPLAAAGGILTGLQALVSRALNPMDPVVLSICAVSGGDTHNVIPGEAELLGTVRYLNPDLRSTMPDLIRSCVEQIASGYRCRAEIEYDEVTPVLSNTEPGASLVRAAATTVVTEANVSRQDPILAGEDFSWYLNRLPGCFYSLGSGGPNEVHHPGFTIDETCLEVGAEVMAEVAVRAGRETKFQLEGQP